MPGVIPGLVNWNLKESTSAEVAICGLEEIGKLYSRGGGNILTSVDPTPVFGHSWGHL
jgi:hypothetical protein